MESKGLEKYPKALKRLHDSVVKGIRSDQLSNIELADWLIENIWSDYEIDSDKSAMLGAVIGRLYKEKDNG